MGETMVAVRHFVDGKASIGRHVYETDATHGALASAIAEAATSIQARTGYRGPVMVAPIPDVPSLGYEKEPATFLIRAAGRIAQGAVELRDIFVACEREEVKEADGAVAHRRVIEYDVIEPSSSWMQSFEAPVLAVGFCTRPDFDDAFDAIVVNRANEVLGWLPGGGDRVADVMRIDRVLSMGLEAATRRIVNDEAEGSRLSSIGKA